MFTSPFTPRPFAIWHALLALAALLGWGGASPALAASCGDYVLVRNPQQTSEAALARGAHPVRLGGPKLPCPCHGPQCGGGSSQPGPVLPERIQPTEKVTLTLSSPANTPSRECFVMERPAAHPLHLASGLLRPPNFS